MTYEEAVSVIRPGRYRHFKGNEYEVIAVARHSETEEPMVVYRALYGSRGIWVRPAAMWNEEIVRGGVDPLVQRPAGAVSLHPGSQHHDGVQPVRGLLEGG